MTSTDALKYHPWMMQNIHPRQTICKGEVSMPTLQELLQAKGIDSLAAFAKRCRLTPQQAWNVWSGFRGVGPTMALVIHQRCGVPLKALLAVKHAARYSRANERKRQPA
jgi:hypothetical protein